MDREKVQNYLDYVKALFKLEFQPLYGDSVYCDCGRYNKFTGWEYHVRCCICADIDGEWDEDKDWIIELNLDFDNAIGVNIKHPDFDDEGMEEYLDDFIEEIKKHI